MDLYSAVDIPGLKVQIDFKCDFPNNFVSTNLKESLAQRLNCKTVDCSLLLMKDFDAAMYLVFHGEGVHALMQFMCLPHCCVVTLG